MTAAAATTTTTATTLQHCTEDFWHDAGSRGDYLIF